MIVTKVNEMIATRKRLNQITDIRERAIAYHDEVAPYIDGPQSIRQHIDELELIVEDDMWTLPKYRELLFIR
jgi:glutamine synthetase